MTTLNPYNLDYGRKNWRSIMSGIDVLALLAVSAIGAFIYWLAAQDRER